MDPSTDLGLILSVFSGVGLCVLAYWKFFVGHERHVDVSELKSGKKFDVSTGEPQEVHPDSDVTDAKSQSGGFSPSCGVPLSSDSSNEAQVEEKHPAEDEEKAPEVDVPVEPEKKLSTKELVAKLEASLKSNRLNKAPFAGAVSMFGPNSNFPRTATPHSTPVSSSAALDRDVFGRAGKDEFGQDRIQLLNSCSKARIEGIPVVRRRPPSFRGRRMALAESDDTHFDADMDFR